MDDEEGAYERVRFFYILKEQIGQRKEDREEI